VKRLSVRKDGEKNKGKLRTVQVHEQEMFGEGLTSGKKERKKSLERDGAEKVKRRLFLAEWKLQ